MSGQGGNWKKGLQLDGQEGPSSDMIRKLRRMYKQFIFLFLFVLGLWTLLHRNEARTINVTTGRRPQTVFSKELLQELNDTVHNYPMLVSTIERVGPGIDPRTEQLRNLTLIALASLSSRSCNAREKFLDRFITDTTDTQVLRHKYMQEIGIVRTVVETSQPEKFVSASTGNAITLLTQLTSDRTYMLDIILRRWEGPLIAVVYAGADMVAPKHKQLSNWLSKIDRENVALLLVIKSGSLYPVNWLRNLAISRSYSKYIFVTDGDFVPSVNLYKTLLRHLDKLEAEGRTKTVILVPAYEMLVNDMKIPATREDLLRDYKLGLVDGFHKGSFEAAHNLTNYRKWSTATEPYILPHQNPCNDHFEPYLVMDSARSPYFPETLLERRKNKIAYQYELCTNGYDYIVIHDGFLIHKHHPESMRALAKVDQCVEEAWKVFKDYCKTHPMQTA